MDVDHPVIEFLLTHFDVDDIRKIDPFAGYNGECWEMANEAEIIADFKLDAQHPEVCLGGEFSHVRIAYPGRMEQVIKSCDLNRVCPTNIFCTHKTNSCDATFLIKKNFVHAGFQDKTLSEMTSAATYIPEAGDAFMEVRGKENSDCNHVALRALSFGKTEINFIKTNALINEVNILNGILEIHQSDWEGDLPDEVSFFITQTVDEQKFLEEVSYKPQVYYAIPGNHILAWPLALSDVARRQRGIVALELRTVEQKLLYYFVPDICFRKIHSDFTVLMMNQVDIRPLKEIGFKAILKKEGQSQQAEILLKTSISFVAFPSMTDQQIMNLKPTLSPNFRPISEWIHGQQLGNHVIT